MLVQAVHCPTWQTRRVGGSCRSAGAGAGRRSGRAESFPASGLCRRSKRCPAGGIRAGGKLLRSARLCRGRRGGAPVVNGNGVGNRVVEHVAADAVADRVRPIGCIGCDRVIVRAVSGMEPSIEGNGFWPGIGENVAGDSFEPKSRHVEMENDFVLGVVDGAENAVILEYR